MQNIDWKETNLQATNLWKYSSESTELDKTLWNNIEWIKTTSQIQLKCLNISETLMGWKFKTEIIKCKLFKLDWNNYTKETLLNQLIYWIEKCFIVVFPLLIVDLSSIKEFCWCLVATNINKIYLLIDRLFCLIMTLLVSIFTTDRSFSAMRIINIRLINMMGGEFLIDNMKVYIEGKVSESITYKSIIDKFKSLEICRVLI